jgi:hypothetical protein
MAKAVILMARRPIRGVVSGPPHAEIAAMT